MSDRHGDEKRVDTPLREVTNALPQLEKLAE
jgi:hypothetical protein